LVAGRGDRLNELEIGEVNLIADTLGLQLAYGFAELGNFIGFVSEPS